MRVRPVIIAGVMTARELRRNRIALLLLFLVPTLFFGLVAFTTTTRPVSFKLAAVSEQTFIQVSERAESLIFVGAAIGGLLAAFLALGMVQKHHETNRRLVLCGYRSGELVVAKLAVLVGATLAVAVYVTGLLRLFFRPEHPGLLVAGLAAAGLVNGCYGLLIGAVCRRELEGILFIVLLANIDAGWLQNPVFYAGAQNQFIIRLLPAYHPCQASMMAAFTHESPAGSIMGSLIYGGALLSLALTAYFLRMRVRR